MTLLVFGTSGQVATELRGLAPVTALGRAQADLTDPASCAAAIHAHRPRAVINAAPYTAVDRAESEEALATIMNADAPGAMARWRPPVRSSPSIATETPPSMIGFSPGCAVASASSISPTVTASTVTTSAPSVSRRKPDQR